jgi:tRNA nucleotidyltransferase (CCA-adding enzyme)
MEGAVNLIITHIHGDFDALAAAVAAGKLYPDSKAVLPEPVHLHVRSFINLYRDLLPLDDEPDRNSPDLVVVVDTQKKSRLGSCEAVVDRAAELHLFDHHPEENGEDGITASRARVEPVGASTTLLVEEIVEKNIGLTDLEATLMVMGIYEDTGFLTFNTTTARDVTAAGYLWQHYNIDTGIIQQFLRSPLALAQRELFEKLVEGSEYFELRGRRIVLSTCSIEEYVQGLAALLQHLLVLDDAEVVIALVSMHHTLYIAARTQSDDLDLRQLLSPLGVKGHPQAVSGDIKKGDLVQVKEDVLELLRSSLPPPLRALQAASTPVGTVAADTVAAEAFDLLFQRGHRGCPVMQGTKMVGMISRRDLEMALRHNLGNVPVKAFMKRKVITALPDQSIAELRRIMAARNIGRIPVVDSERNLLGIVTRSDVLRAIGLTDRKGKAADGCNSRNSLVLKKALPVQGSLQQVDNLADIINRELPERLKTMLLIIGQCAVREKAKVNLVGGIIRDLLLGASLSKDLDFVVQPDALSLARALRAYLGGTLKLFEEFGTATLFLKDGLRLDLVTARKEFYASPAALPQVEASSLRNDLFRRDFTINTLACSLMPETFGRLYDFFDGRRDLEQGVIRTLYNLSFVDDPLRILRAVRFEKRFGFAIEPGTMALIKKAVKSRVLEKLTRQRLNNEVALIYSEDEPVEILKRLDELGIFSFLYPGIRPGPRAWERLSRVEKAACWVARRSWERMPMMELVYMAALVYEMEEPERSILLLRRVRISRKRYETIAAACRETPGF